MNNRPIGVFDSGLGGLTAVKEILAALPEEDIVYFGDTGRVPYGTRSFDTIVKYARQDAAFLLSHDVKMIIAACGTVSSIFPKELTDRLPAPYLGVVEPAVQAALEATRTGRIGVIGTSATIRSGSYTRLLKKHRPDVVTAEAACPLLVSLVENGYIDRENFVTRTVVQEYLAPIRAAGVDTLILGCTHYPIIAPIIADVMGSGVTLIDPGKETVLCAARLLGEQGLLAQSGRTGQASFYVSDTADSFEQLAGIFLQRTVPAVHKIDIESVPIL